MKYRTVGPLALLLLSFAGTSLDAQKGTGQVAGTVFDSSKTAVAAALVTVTDLSSKVERTTKSTPEGTYLLAKLSAGSYEMKTQADGFQTVKQHLFVSYDASVHVNIHLERSSPEPRKKK